MLLAIDSATPACSVALIDGHSLVDERHETVGRGHSERLAPMIAELLGNRRPTAVLVDCGPGSFTGLRVGLATAHGLAIGWSVPLSGCSSMALIAAAADEPELAVALAAGHGELFVQSWAHDPLRPTDELRSLRPEEAAAVIGCEAVYGSGAQSLVDSRGHGRAVEALPRAAAARLLPKGLRTFPAVPIYGRAPDARLPG